MPTLVSIVIPCYKGEAYLPAAVESCLGQSFQDMEVVVVDDASPDGCGRLADASAARDPRIHVIHHPQNRGVAEAFNSGFNAARGNYLTRLAQDDLFEPSAVQAMAEFLDEHPDIDMVYADMELIDESGRSLGIWKAKPSESVLRGGSGLGLCWMFRRAVWEREPRGFDPKFDQIEDFEFWMRASRHSRLAKLDGPPLLKFRQHPGMGTAQHAARMELLTAEVLAKYSSSSVAARQARAEGAFNASYIHRGTGDWVKARTLAWSAIRSWPFKLRYLRNALGAGFRRPVAGPLTAKLGRP